MNRYFIFLLSLLISTKLCAQIHPYDQFEGTVETIDGRVLKGTISLDEGYTRLNLQSDGKQYIFQPSQLKRAQMKLLGDDEQQEMVVRQTDGRNGQQKKLLMTVLLNDPLYSLYEIEQAYTTQDYELNGRRNTVTTVDKYIFKSEYYIQYLSDPVIKISNSKNSWLKVLPEKKKEISDFIDNGHLDLANEAHVVKLVKYINTLAQ